MSCEDMGTGLGWWCAIELLLVLCMTTTTTTAGVCIECEQSKRPITYALLGALSNEAADVGADLGWPSGCAWRIRRMRGAGETVVH